MCNREIVYIKLIWQRYVDVMMLGFTKCRKVHSFQ